MQKLPAANIAYLRSKLKNATNKNFEQRYTHRLHCVLLVAQGCSCNQVAHWFGGHPRTIERWMQQMQDFGIEGLKDENKIGRPTKFSDDQYVLIRRDVLKNPADFGYASDTWNGKLLQMYLAQQFSINLSVRQCQRLLQQFPHYTGKNYSFKTT